MRIELVIVAAFAACTAACGGYGERYPSYEAIVAQYVPSGPYAGEPLDAGSAPDCVYPSCPCPRLWYDAHWVYYCDGRWVYWHSDCWYWYPVFYVSYVGGVAYVVDGPFRHITDHPLAGPPGGGGSPWSANPFSPDAPRRSRDGAETRPERAAPATRPSSDSSSGARHPSGHR
jgi:hypothetical protein